jgi:hypothetical protein
VATATGVDAAAIDTLDSQGLRNLSRALAALQHHAAERAAAQSGVATWQPALESPWPSVAALMAARCCPPRCSLRHLDAATIRALYREYADDRDRPYAPRTPTLADFRANKLPATADTTLRRHLRAHLGLRWPPL